LEKEINILVEKKDLLQKDNYEIFWEEHHGGYAKKTPELINFISKFNSEHDFKIEPIYSGKMFFAFDKLIKTTIKPNSTVVLIHTGGLQGLI
jgi:1-aminocyclopropane-1-carboxylate deaminase